LVPNVETLLDTIYGAGADPSQWPEALVTLSDHFGADGGMIVYNAPSPEHSMMVTGRLSEELCDLYTRHYVWNPWTLAMKNVPFDRAVIANSLIEPGTIRKTALYADILAPQRTEDMFCISYRGLAHDGGLGGLGFSLSAKGSEKAGENLSTLQALVPHLHRALDTTFTIGNLSLGRRPFARVVDLMPNATLLLDEKGKVTHANAAAQMLLGEKDGLALDRDSGQVCAALESEKTAFSKMLSRALSVATAKKHGLGGSFRLSRPLGGYPLLVLPVPLPSPAFRLWELFRPARIMVLVIDPSMQPNAPDALMHGIFGLTLVESRIAVLLARGLSGSQIAIKLGISHALVKLHANKCFQKTKVRSKVDLARILWALSADMPVLSPAGKAN
jgi:DNA-binding CsgD family transcriptional regulator/PAS domain-containing protein